MGAQVLPAMSCTGPEVLAYDASIQLTVIYFDYSDILQQKHQEVTLE